MRKRDASKNNGDNDERVVTKEVRLLHMGMGKEGIEGGKRGYT